MRDGSTYLGPYASAAGLRDSLDTIRKAFPLRSCSDAVFRNRSRPCLEYQIKRCMAPCVLEVEREEYGRHLDGAIQLLEGKTETLAADLMARMRAASEEERFEEAARIRDRIPTNPQSPIRNLFSFPRVRECSRPCVARGRWVRERWV